ncbi:MAG: rod shape-determining protein MreC [Patescibacteria group bacterium]
MKQWLILIGLSGLLWWADGQGYFNNLKSKIYQAKLKPAGLASEDKSQLAAAEAELIKVNQENKNLRELLGVKLPAKWQFMPAKILQLKNESLTIDIGSEDGIKVGQTVIGIKKNEVNNGIAVGRIKTVRAFQAEVELVTSPGAGIKVKLENGAEGVARSEQDRWQVAEVLQKFTLIPGQLMVTAGGDGRPAGLALGRVGEVFKEDEAVYQKAGVEKLIEIETLSQVFVISE